MCSLPPVWGQLCEISAAATAPTTRLRCTITNTSPLGLQTQLNSFFYKLRWSWCLLRATENELRHLTSKIRKTKRARSISILRFLQLSVLFPMSLHDPSRECGYDLDTDLSDYYVFIHVTATGVLLFKATRANKSSLASTISQRRHRKDNDFKAGSLS